MDFDFATVPSVIFRHGAARQLGPLLAERFETRAALLVTDQGLRQAGLLDPALASLTEAGFTVRMFEDVVADPPEAIVEAAAAAARELTANLATQPAASKSGSLVIGFGGGSSMDVAKLAAALAGGDQPLKTMYGVGQVDRAASPDRRLPLVQIPTTAGTGAEVTPVAIVTRGADLKMGVVSPVLYADIALLDAELTLGLPPAVTAATGVDAMVHAIEAFTTKHKKNPISDALALQALGLLAEAVPRAYRNGSDLEAREKALLGAMLAGQAFANAPVAAVHALAYPLGGIFHLPHGLSNALVLPHVLRFNMEAAAPLYAALRPAITPGGASDAGAFVAEMDALCEAVGVRQRLRDHQISHNDLPRLAEDAMKQTRLLTNNPREVTYEDALAIYAAAL
ncbi:MAG: iron-containing alcohol dehydrogenase [Pseudomonadota bacterium]